MHIAFISLRLVALGSLFAIPAMVGAQANTDGASLLDQTTNTLGEWVELERRIAQETSEWAIEQQSLQDLLAIYRTELEALTQQIEAAENEVSAAETARAELTAKNERLREFEAAVLEAIVEAELTILTLQRKLPPPLQEEIQPFFAQVPQNPRESDLSIGQRIQFVAGILTQVQKFNIGVTIEEDFREFESGTPVQIDAIYFGLGAAYYVDKADAHAGIGIVTAEGWTWREDDSLIPVVRQFVEVYRGLQQPTYVELPVILQ